MAERRGQAGRRRRREWVERLLDLDLMWSVVAVALAVVFIVPHVGVGVRDYRPGDIAVADVVAPIDFQVRDPVSTQRRRQEAVSRVLPVYDFDPTAWRGAATSLRELFEWGREMRGESSDTRWSDLAPEGQRELRSRAESIFGRPLPESLLPLLWSQGFDSELERSLVRALRREVESGLIGNPELIDAAESSAITIRNISTQQERRLERLDTISDFETAQNRLRQAVMEELDRPVEVEELLAGWAATMLRPNVTFNSNETQERRRQARTGVEPVFYEVKQGRKILREGDEVTEQAIAELEALGEQWSTERSWGSVAGVVVLLSLAVFSLWRYALHYQRRFRNQKVRHLYLLLLVVLVGLVGAARAFLFVGEAVADAFARAPFNLRECYEFAVPFAVGPLVVLLLVDAQVAWIFSAVAAVAVGAMTQDLGLTVFFLVGSFAAIYGMSQYKQRTALLRTGLWIGGANVMTIVGLGLLNPAPDAWSIVGFKIVCGLVGGMGVALLASAALPALEHLFNTMTDIKLLELANMNLPLLKNLAVKAPGTYHHSVVVGTLGEAAAEAIGANSLFVRVAAYYHDIGKVHQPHYFIENQREGANPHDKLSPYMSALILVSHVKEGVADAEEHGLPQPLVDVIPQHHGTRLMSFFYDKARRQADPELDEVNPEDFRYPGPKPQSKEAGILMLADGVEATCRALDDVGPADLRAVVKRTIQDVLDDGQLDECGLTLADLSGIADAFTSVLEGMHHQRIEYPSAPEDGGVEELEQLEELSARDTVDATVDTR